VLLTLVRTNFERFFSGVLSNVSSQDTRSGERFAAIDALVRSFAAVYLSHTLAFYYFYYVYYFLLLSHAVTIQYKRYVSKFILISEYVSLQRAVSQSPDAVFSAF